MKRASRTVWAVCAMGILIAAGCKGKSRAAEGDSTGSVAPAGAGSVHVTYQPDVKVMEQAEAEDQIIGQSSDGAALLFASSSHKAGELKEGDVLLVKGMFARKVWGAEAGPDGVLVLTQQATIPEVVQDGTMDVQAPIRFGALQAGNDEQVSLPWNPARGWMHPYSVRAQIGDAASMSKAEEKGRRDAYGNMAKAAVSSVTEGWNTTFKATPAEGKLNLELTLSKEVGDFAAKITGDGYLANFNFNSTMGVKQSAMDRFQTGFKNLNGVMNFKWEVAKKDAGPHSEDVRIKLPAAVTIPLAQYLEGMPLFLEISSALIVKPEIAGAELSHGSFRITYDGYQSFQVKKGNVDSSGNVTGNIEYFEPLNVAPAAPMGLVVAFAAPRLELSFGTAKVFKMETLKVAAEKVDKLADELARRLLQPEQYAAFKAGPMGRFSLGQAAEKALQSEAAAYFEMVSSSGMSYSGLSVLTPCSRADVTLLGVVGASAEFFGESVADSRKEIFKKQITKITPPGTKLCKDLAND
ncbi:MAG TPA: hypothetical protein VK525_21970 [Candidatus Saccharimonadales bacterium]|nr:hypothetical protein [Candidatus Saccharimonadales bacterium]